MGAVRTLAAGLADEAEWASLAGNAPVMWRPVLGRPGPGDDAGCRGDRKELDD
jgi:hypothetical protein